jgi:addiction module RelE/StbE family toxin
MKLVFSKLFDEDVDSTYQYIQKKLEAPMAANNLIEELIKKLNYLKETPHTRALVRDDFLASLGFRSIHIKNHTVFYIIREEQNEVAIVRVLYKGRDWINILKENDFEEIFYE